MDVECPSCHALHWKGEKLTNSSACSPHFGMCCDSGQVHVPLLQDPPLFLCQLLESNDAQAIDFRTRIWQYNRTFAFTSLGVSEDHLINNGRGPPVFRVHGELRHYSGSLLPTAEHHPRYAQLYIYDPCDSLQYRQHNNSDLRIDTLTSLQNLILNNHQYAPLYKFVYCILQDYSSDEEASIRLRVAPGSNRRTHNLPVADKVAVILPGDISAAEHRDIVLHLRNGPLHRISEDHPAYMPLQYPLLFPYGENGWYSDLHLHQPDAQNPHRLTLTRYAAFRLHSCTNEYSTILHAGRLAQRYHVDNWVAAEQMRLSFLRSNQSRLRASLYSGLEDTLWNDNEPTLNDIGQRIVLPSSFIGGPRHMYQQYQDSLTIARAFRKVDLFGTMTANPNWQEVLRELFPGQIPSDRPDLIARVFHLKKTAVVDEITKKGIFGHSVAHIFTIEFQKHGLPHMHILIFLAPEHKLQTPADIDSTIRAYWPNPVTEPLLFETVKRFMVHGPCGPANPHAPCMENGCCTKNFPRPFSSATRFDEHGYPQYYRPDDGVAYEVGGYLVDNRWIVPYNPYLTVRYVAPL